MRVNILKLVRDYRTANSGSEPTRICVPMSIKPSNYDEESHSVVVGEKTIPLPQKVEFMDIPEVVLE